MQIATETDCWVLKFVLSEMFSVLGTQRDLSKFTSTINGHGNTFVGDGITANIGAPPRNGNYLLKKSPEL